MEIIPGPEWDELLERLIRQKGTAVLLGATDSGKSTLMCQIKSQTALRQQCF